MSGQEGKTRTERYSFSIESSGGHDIQINDSGLSAFMKAGSPRTPRRKRREFEMGKLLPI